MANRYINAGVSLSSTSATDLYQVPSGCSALVQSLNAANESGSAATITAALYDASTGNTFTLLHQASIPTASAANLVDRPLALEAGDKLILTAGASNAFDITASILLVDESSAVPVGTISTASLYGDDFDLYIKLRNEVFG